MRKWKGLIMCLKGRITKAAEKDVADNAKRQKTSAMIGWECPKCGSVYAWWVEACATCRNSNIKIISTNTVNWKIVK